MRGKMECYKSHKIENAMGSIAWRTIETELQHHERDQPAS